jgi:hypothetical protein
LLECAVDRRPTDFQHPRYGSQRLAFRHQLTRKAQHGITQGEFSEWADEYHRGGVDALKVNKKGLEAEYRAEVKRLQSKIGELVMENEIRKEAIRPFSLVERTLNGSLRDDDAPKP